METPNQEEFISNINNKRALRDIFNLMGALNTHAI